MEIITNTTDFYLEKETAVAIGKFDGLHIGHRRLLEEILSKKKEGLAACVFTFDPAPSVLFGHSDGKELTTREEKRFLFQRMGVDVLIEFPLTLETAAILPGVFAAEILSKQMNARFIAAGEDLSFGAGGAGNAALLQRMAPECGFTVKTIEKVCLEGVEVSSTYVRTQVEQGNMELAEALLGMPYTVMGTVQHGNKIGRTIGMPTVNLIPGASKLLPPFGVYFSVLQLGDKKYRAISNIGCKPTVSEDRMVGVETYIYDFTEDIYGRTVEVGLCSFRRPERHFPDLQALQKQLREDMEAGKDWESKINVKNVKKV